jgi:hypothetical protein
MAAARSGSCSLADRQAFGAAALGDDGQGVGAPLARVAQVGS